LLSSQLNSCKNMGVLFDIFVPNTLNVALYEGIFYDLH